MTDSVGQTRAERAEDTRAAILVAAERLFAERGVNNVSHRRIVAEAGQGNNAAVAYHFGTKAAVVRAIERSHAEHIEQLLAQHVDRVAGSSNLQDWVGCLVWSYTDHLASLGTPSWYARFCAQAMTDPTYAKVMTSSALTSSALHEVLDGIGKCLPALPDYVHAERHLYSRLLLNHVCAEYEAGFAEGRSLPRPTWNAIGTGLVDAIVGLWQASVTPLAKP